MSAISRRTKLAVGTVAIAALALAGCSPSEVDSETKVDTATTAQVTATPTTAATSTASMAVEQGVTFTDAYVKAKPADKDMTAIFGVITNNTDKTVNVVGFTSSIEAGKYEIHEVVDGKMRMKEGGVEIAPGESYVLEPGHDHLMLMEAKGEIAAGDTATVTLELSDGTTVEVTDLPVRTVASGEEDYGDLHDGHEMGSTATSAAAHS